MITYSSITTVSQKKPYSISCQRQKKMSGMAEKSFVGNDDYIDE